MNLLVLGGTQFIGPHIVHALQEAGHHVTIFNRGKTPDTLQHVTRLQGDRVETELSALQGLSFDATVDLSAYLPRSVRETIETLADPGFYCFVSTISVYSDTATPFQTEDAPVATLQTPEVEEITGDTYGGLKALCETTVRAATPRHCILRPGLVVGPGDVTDRFTYWVVKAAQEKKIVAPDSSMTPMQWIDVRDLARFAVKAIEEEVTGTFNLVTPPESRTLGDVLQQASALTGNEPEIVWLSVEQVEELELQPWLDFPGWLPPTGESGGLMRTSSQKAITAGLEISSTESTVKALWDWWTSRPKEKQVLTRGLAPEREQEILQTLSR
jgi:2'-hydroxyisoflavone reductase